METRKRGKAVNHRLRKYEAEEEDVMKLLLLGTGGSGKSTLCKQIINMYGRGFTKSDLERMTPMVYHNVVSNMQRLIKYSYHYAKAEDREYAISSELKGDCKEFMDQDLSLQTNVTLEEGRKIARFWADPGIQKTFMMRHHFGLQPNAKYFFDHIERIARPGYVVSFEDFVQTRTATTGIVERKFHMGGHGFRLVDVGGQRSERRKWIHCFSEVACVMYVCAISEYNEEIFEASNTNSLEESMRLFKEICNSECFKRTHMILFLNKRDVFAEKIKECCITTCPALADYKGDSSDVKETTKFIRDKFFSMNELYDKTIYAHVTCATDPSNVRFVFSSVADIVLQNSLDVTMPGW
eukprot:CAMPEP_0167797662 /NCGR_PEP_ID=MMETSP0111_2-20121227/15799_1 /TAXON_ID=91324 /ORGANISM="Lotharella globosa, Strain CCCM811" /LENGTH=352 /DNA_ID=CAMNT_0007691833 /DNA_START=125 /DNA_END=1180 /DNA_ORIENTATION=-